MQPESWMQLKMPLVPRPPLVRNPQILLGVRKRVTSVSFMNSILDGVDNKVIVGSLAINQPPIGHKRENAKYDMVISVVLCCMLGVPNAIMLRLLPPYRGRPLPILSCLLLPLVPPRLSVSLGICRRPALTTEDSN